MEEDDCSETALLCEATPSPEVAQLLPLLDILNKYYLGSTILLNTDLANLTLTASLRSSVPGADE